MTPSYSFFISYDKTAVMDELCYPAFDLDDGFMTYGGGRSPIINEMNKAFARWKKSDRTGLVFSEQDSNPLVLADSENTAGTTRSRRNSFFSTSLSNQKQEDYCYSDVAPQ